MGLYRAMKESSESTNNRISGQNYREIKLQVYLYLNERSFDFWNFYAVYMQRRSLFFLRIPLLDTTYFGLTGHLQVYRLLWLRILLLPVMGFSFLVL
jgi:hypothetical protein